MDYYECNNKWRNQGWIVLSKKYNGVVSTQKKKIYI